MEAPIREILPTDQSLDQDIVAVRPVEEFVDNIVKNWLKGAMTRLRNARGGDILQPQEILSASEAVNATVGAVISNCEVLANRTQQKLSAALRDVVYRTLAEAVTISEGTPYGVQIAERIQKFQGEKSGIFSKAA